MRVRIQIIMVSRVHSPAFVNISIGYLGCYLVSIATIKKRKDHIKSQFIHMYTLFLFVVIVVSGNL
ncbi:hypothetical protein CLU79DRAFT_760483 [Phycomyces nitens]|nr:hypothetical protein CLU79DRAFT_760483 [Phycomyces nitens]